jgi:3-hydroxybutyrate dehydrogenase
MLTDRVALVTGSTSGIGRAIAGCLARNGADLMISGRRRPDATTDAFCRRLERLYNVRTAYRQADIAHPEQVVALVEATAATLGRLDILVNNAGIQHTQPIETFPAECWDAILAVNLTSAFHAIRAALPGMRQRDWGRIVNIASTHGLVASRDKAAYVAAKHGLIGLTKVVALETAATGVTCNAVCPGWVRTPLVEKQIEARAAASGIGPDAAAQALVAEKQPSGAFVTAEEIGEAVVFLCSPAAAQIRGHALVVDGGWLAQ